MMHSLSNNELARVAPSIIAVAASDRVSHKYSFVPTIEVVDALRGAGWAPVKAIECRVRSDARRGFQKHMIRFRHTDQIARSANEYLSELVLTNAHDGSAAYQLHAGVFRIVCSNGLVVADETFARISVKHVGFKKEDVIDASFKILSEVPKIEGAVDGMRSLQLTAGEQTIFAQAALTAKYGDEPTPVDASRILRARRHADVNSDLWSTFNRVQENLLQGGLRGINPRTHKRVTTREVKSIDGNINLNKALWQLAEAMRAQKVAQ